MSYLFRPQREEFATKIVKEAGLENTYEGQLFIKNFSDFQNVNLGDYEKDNFFDWIKQSDSNRKEIRSTIKNKVNSPKEVYEFIKSKI